MKKSLVPNCKLPARGPYTCLSSDAGRLADVGDPTAPKFVYDVLGGNGTCGTPAEAIAAEGQRQSQRLPQNQDIKQTHSPEKPFCDCSGPANCCLGAE